MRCDLRGKTATVFLGISLLAWGGCASSRQASFYTLSPMHAPGDQIERVQTRQEIVVAVGPVTVPDYLNRPQIVTRTGPTGVQLDEFERWAGSLEQDVSRVLAENLSVLLSPDNVTVVRWLRESSTFPAGYRVVVDVNRFDGDPGKSVFLTARWSVRGEQQGKILSAGESNITEPVAGQEYNALVEAMSRALAALAREIAPTIPVK